MCKSGLLGLIGTVAESVIGSCRLGGPGSRRRDCFFGEHTIRAGYGSLTLSFDAMRLSCAHATTGKPYHAGWYRVPDESVVTHTPLQGHTHLIHGNFLVALSAFSILVLEFFYRFFTNRPFRRMSMDNDSTTTLFNYRQRWTPRLQLLSATIAFCCLALYIR